MRGRGTRTGFYYICLDSETGGILGFYYHQAWLPPAPPAPCPRRVLTDCASPTQKRYRPSQAPSESIRAWAARPGRSCGPEPLPT